MVRGAKWKGGKDESSHRLQQPQRYVTAERRRHDHDVIDYLSKQRPEQSRETTTTATLFQPAREMQREHTHYQTPHPAGTVLWYAFWGAGQCG